MEKEKAREVAERFMNTEFARHELQQRSRDTVILILTEFQEWQKSRGENTRQTFTKEEVEELLREQRKICADEYNASMMKNRGRWITHNNIIHAPSPIERGGEDG